MEVYRQARRDRAMEEDFIHDNVMAAGWFFICKVYSTVQAAEWNELLEYTSIVRFRSVSSWAEREPG
jgi:hypothetical protein